MIHKYTLNGLNCANCAAKIENKFQNIENYKNARLVFATKTLSFDSEITTDLTADVQKIVDSIEDGVMVVNETFKPTVHNVKAHNSDKSQSTHSHNENSQIQTVLLWVGTLFLLASILFEVLNFNEIIVGILCGISVICAGYEVIIKGFKAILKLRLDETTLMSIAVIAAFFLGEFVEAALVTVLFGIGELLEDKAVNSSRREIEKLANIRPDTAILFKNNTEQIVSAQQVEVGDTIVVKPYDRIPLDGIITEGSTFLDTSAITGESLPVNAEIGTEVMSGMMNNEGLIRINVTKAFSESTASRILKLVEDAAATKGNREKLITRFAAVYTPIMLLIALAIAIIPPILGLGEFSTWLSRSLVCLVASCPCSIVISVPLSYYAGIGAASKIGVLIKGGKYVEALSCADTFVFDKTGTLTTGKLTVTGITAYKDYTKEEILQIAAACEEYSNHPVANAINAAAETAEKSSNNNTFTVTNHKEKAGYGVVATLNGAEISCTNSKMLNEQTKAIANDNDTVFIIYNGSLIGSLSVADSIRNESFDVIKKLKTLGAKSLVMLTGDSSKIANKVANELQLTRHFSQLLPQDKVAKIQEEKKSATACCFVGDGINDAPVLANSDCGIAMGLGSEAAIEAADLVLTSGDLKRLPDAVKLCRTVVRTVKINILFSLFVKAVIITLAAFGIAPMWLAVFADTGVSVLCVLNSIRILKR